MSARTRSLSLLSRSLVGNARAVSWRHLLTILLLGFFNLNIRSIGVQPLQDIEEVNMFKDDNTVVHFKRPLSKIYYRDEKNMSKP